MSRQRPEVVTVIADREEAGLYTVTESAQIDTSCNEERDRLVEVAMSTLSSVDEIRLVSSDGMGGRTVGSFILAAATTWTRPTAKLGFIDGAGAGKSGPWHTDRRLLPVRQARANMIGQEFGVTEPID